MAGLRILIADDNLDSAATLAYLLELMGHTAREAHDGEAALARVAEFDPQLVLLDIEMPGHNGYEVCRRIRQSDGGHRRAIFAVTGWGEPQDRAQFDEAGFDRHLAKPLDPDELERIIAALSQTGLLGG